MADPIIKPAVQLDLLSRRRMMAWMAWIEGNGDDLYCWTGAHNIEWDGQTWQGLGHLISISAQMRTSEIEYIEREITLNGLDPSILVTDLLGDVRGNAMKIWMATLDEGERIRPDPVLMAEPVQDTIEWRMTNEGANCALVLKTYEALPFVGRARNEFWSHEGQLRDYPSESSGETGDVGLQYTLKIGQTQAPTDWQAP